MRIAGPAAAAAPTRSPRSDALRAVSAMLDEAESTIRDLLRGATGPPTKRNEEGAPNVAWRGTIVGGEPAADREAERRGARRVQPLRPVTPRFAIARG